MAAKAEAAERPLRILHVLSQRGFSGGENQLAAIVRHLHRADYQQSFVLHPGAQFRSIADEIGAPVQELRMANDVDLGAVLRLRGIFRRSDADVISFGCARGHKLGGLACAGAKGLPPRLATRRMDYPLRGKLKRWLYRTAVQRVIVISEAVKEQVLHLGVPEAQVELIHEGVPSAELSALRRPEARAAARAELGIDGDVVLGVTLASLHERKGLDLLIDALSELALAPGQRLLWCVGGQGPLLAELQKHAASKAREGAELRLLGQVSAQKLLAAADLFCLPSRLEGLGVALLEAMASGLPAVASRVGGMQDSLVDGETGFFAEPGEVDSLRSALERLLSTPESWRQLGDAAAARAAERFDVQGMCRATERVYQELAVLGRRVPG
ncbi:MAG: hypothetical protein CSA62_14255 [Planctomycetota bacterium]|nr:MAG: hypothetical protein CSA62_14255 [Planctomycetota bacterium]